MLATTASPTTPAGALYAYNHADWPTSTRCSPGPPPTQADAAARRRTAARRRRAPAAAGSAVSYALAQLGTPYLWGGDEPGGFDCSGLAQAAYAAAGIQLPRIAQAQYDAGPPVPAGQPLQPGDLVFFGADTSHVDHVGIVINQTEMVDAPHTGAARPHRALPLARLPRRHPPRRLTSHHARQYSHMSSVLIK